ncbi:hypothetical protein ACQ5SO_16460 [Rhodovulum sp. DZ06]|uniref:hypothetical protein n=1 Tax=Rhodovulum sp. DZ06 TaxID=3425126 RepID=UPI003D35237D
MTDPGRDAISGGMSPLRPLAALLACALCALPAPPAAADWRAARWDAAPEQARAVAGQAQEIALGYGGGLTARLMGEERVAGRVFRALWQFDAGGLRQVLMERRGPDATPGDAQAVLAALTGAHGPPGLLCDAPRDRVRAAAWRLPGGVLHLVAFDWTGGPAFARSAADLLRPGEREIPAPPAAPRPTLSERIAAEAARALVDESPPGARGGLHRRSQPRRLLLRWHDPGAERLIGAACRPAAE